MSDKSLADRLGGAWAKDTETSAFLALVDQVKALEERVTVFTSMTIEAAGAGIVESQEARIEALEGALREISADLKRDQEMDQPLGMSAMNRLEQIARAALHPEATHET